MPSWKSGFTEAGKSSVQPTGGGRSSGKRKEKHFRKGTSKKQYVQHGILFNTGLGNKKGYSSDFLKNIFKKLFYRSSSSLTLSSPGILYFPVGLPPHFCQHTFHPCSPLRSPYITTWPLAAAGGLGSQSAEETGIIRRGFLLLITPKKLLCLSIPARFPPATTGKLPSSHPKRTPPRRSTSILSLRPYSSRTWLHPLGGGSQLLIFYKVNSPLTENSAEVFRTHWHLTH